jgi:hypothetical protein
MNRSPEYRNGDRQIDERSGEALPPRPQIYTAFACFSARSPITGSLNISP